MDPAGLCLNGHLGKELDPSLVDARKLLRPVMYWRRTQEPGR